MFEPTKGASLALGDCGGLGKLLSWGYRKWKVLFWHSLPVPPAKSGWYTLTAGDWLRSHLWACGNCASQALRYVLCFAHVVPDRWAAFSPGTSIPLGWLDGADSGKVIWAQPLEEYLCVEMRRALVSGDRCRPDKAGAPAGFVKSASDRRTRGQAVAESTIGLVLSFRGAAAGSAVTQLVWRRWGSLCCSHHVTFERLAYWPEELGAD